MNSASDIQRTHAWPWFVCGLAVLVGCAVDDSPHAKNSSAAPQTSAQESDAGIDSAPAPRGAGMPIVPIHRVDAGAKSTARATPSGPDAQQADAAASVSVTTVDASDADAGNDALPGNAPMDAGALQPSAAMLPQPIHRYSFSGSGRHVPDEQGGEDALIKGDAQLDGQEAVELNPEGDGLVELPAATLSDVVDFSVLVWLTVSSDACWQRAFDLTLVQQVPVAAPSGGGPGPGPGPAGMTTMGTRSEITSLYLTPYGCPDRLPTLGYVTSTSRYHLIGEDAVEPDEPMLLGLTYSARSQTLRLIVDGDVVKEQHVSLDLHALHRARAWLGHSSAASDPVLDGSISELRVYDSALDSSALKQIDERGPDAL